MLPDRIIKLPREKWYFLAPVAILLILIFWILIPGNILYQKDLGQDHLIKLIEQKEMLELELAAVISGTDENTCSGLNSLPPTWSLGENQLPGVPKTRNTLLKSLEESVVLVIIISNETDQIVSHGSGFFITENKILTNGHVVVGEETNSGIFIINEGLGLHEAKLVNVVLAEDVGQDFAILSIDTAVARPLPVRVVTDSKDLKLKQVYSAGYPGSVIESDLKFHQLIEGTLETAPDLVVTDGVINASQNMFGEIEAHIHTAQISGGNSGGPLVDQCGAVVGLNTYFRSDDEGVRNIAIASQEVFKYLQKQKIAPQYHQTECD